MSNQVILPFTYSGVIAVPFSKSYLQRAIALASLCKNDVTISGYTPSNDAIVAIEIIKNIGCEVTINEASLNISPAVKDTNTIAIHCGEAGLSTRMFAPITASLFNEVEINGEGSILDRPMNMVIDALEQLGSHVGSLKGKLPIKTNGRLQGEEITIDGSETSQLLTGLLIALPTLKEDSIINVINLKSKPYVHMTLDILEHFGVKIENENFEHFKIQGNQTPVANDYKIEGDWSGAAFHIVGAAISGEVRLKNLNKKSSQADRSILEVITLAGAAFSWDNDDLIVQKKALNAFTFDATECPDLFPPIAALAACCSGVSRVKGTSRLMYKESHRALTIQEEFLKLGIRIDLEEDEMIIHGASEIKGGKVDSRNDHRIAMAAAILATQTAEPIEIENPSAINKSYPKFYRDLKQLID